VRTHHTFALEIDMTEPTHHKLAILGSGPAGLTAALYASRADLAPVVFEGNQPGGQLTITTDVENYPGFPEGVMGPDLVDKMREQAQRFGAQCFFELVTEVDFTKRPFKITTDGRECTADSVIISTGATAKQLGLENEALLMGFGVSACATCDGFFFRDKEIVVVGGGDTAMEEATFLTKFASKVTVVHRRDELRASRIMQERAQNNPKIEWRWNSQVEDIHGTKEDGVSSITLRDTKTDETSEFSCQGVFMAIGHRPNTEVFQGILDCDDVGYLKVQHPTTATNVAGVFAAGDVMDPIYRQAVTAAGSGCQAAIDAERWLADEEEAR